MSWHPQKTIDVKRNERATKTPRADLAKGVRFVINMVGPRRLELRTSTLSEWRSNRLSYEPLDEAPIRSYSNFDGASGNSTTNSTGALRATIRTSGSVSESFTGWWGASAGT